MQKYTTELHVVHFLLTIILSLCSVVYANLSDDSLESRASIFQQVNNQNYFPEIPAFEETNELDQDYLTQLVLSELISLSQEFNKTIPEKKRCVIYTLDTRPWLIDMHKKWFQILLIDYPVHFLIALKPILFLMKIGILQVMNLIIYF